MSKTTKHGKELWLDVYKICLPLFKTTHSSISLSKKCADEANDALSEYNKIFGGYDSQVWYGKEK